MAKEPLYLDYMLKWEKKKLLKINEQLIALHAEKKKLIKLASGRRHHRVKKATNKRLNFINSGKASIK